MTNYKHRWLIIIFLVLSAGLQQAQSATIVDTGPANGIQYDFGGSGNQWQAAEFATSQNYTISSVEGWMSGVLGETGTIAIYTDGGDLPGSELFSLGFTGSSDTASWQGISGLSWNLLAGTYWVSFERRSGQTVNGRLPGGSPSPLGNEAHRNTFTANNWVAGDGNNIGVRINALDASPVPLPPALWLFGSGLIGLFGITRCKKALERDR